MLLQREMEQAADTGEAGVIRSSSAAAAAGGAVTASRWTTVTSHGHPTIAECPVCLTAVVVLQFRLRCHKLSQLISVAANVIRIA